MPLRASWLNGIKDSKHFCVFKTKLSHLENQNFQHLNLGYIIYHHRLNNLFSLAYYILGPEQQRPPNLIPRCSLVFPIMLPTSSEGPSLLILPPASKVGPFLFPVELRLTRGVSILSWAIDGILGQIFLRGPGAATWCGMLQRAWNHTNGKGRNGEIPQLRLFWNFLSSHHPPVHLYVLLSCMHVSNMLLCVIQATSQRQPAHGNLSLQTAGELAQAMPSVWLWKPQLHTRINFSIQGVTCSCHLSDFICTNIDVLISIDRIQQVSLL